MARRLSLVTIDQVLSGLSNLAIVIVAAHLLRPQDFGLFALLVLGYGAALVVSRSLISATVLAHPEDSDARPLAILGSAVTLGVATGAAIALTGGALLITGSGLGAAVLWMALLSPLALVQDVGRYLAISAAQPARAITLDLVWIGGEILAFTFLFAVDASSLAACSAAWLGTGAIGGLCVFAQYGLPRLGDLDLRWLRNRWDFSWRMLLAGLADQVGMLLALAVIAAWTASTVVAAVQAVTLLTRPGYMVILAIGQASVPEIARARDDQVALWAHTRRAIVISSAAAALNLAAMLLVPDRLGQILLGRSWVLAEPLILATGLQLVFLALRSGFRSALVGRREIRTVLALDLTGTVVLIPLLVAGAAVNGSIGVAWAGAGGQAFLSIVWWLLFATRLRSRTTNPKHRLEKSSRADELV